MTSALDQRPERIMVIGGRGFVGAAVTRRLIASGRRPHLFGPPMAEDLLADCAGGFDESHGSVEKRDTMARAIAVSGAQALITTAAHSAGRAGLMRSSDVESDRALAINVLGFRNTLEAAREAGIKRLVWTSSTVVYGNAGDYGDTPVDENAPRAPLTFYGLTKQLAEDIAAHMRHCHGQDIVGLRLPLVLGPGLWYQGAASAIAALIRAAGKGPPHRAVFHDAVMDLMHVDDVATALLAVLDRADTAEPVYNINGFRARLSDIVAALKQRFPASDIGIDPEPPALSFPLIDDGRFRKRFGFTPGHSLDDVIDAMLPKETANV